MRRSSQIVCAPHRQAEQGSPSPPVRQGPRLLHPVGRLKHVRRRGLFLHEHDRDLPEQLVAVGRAERDERLPEGLAHQR